MSIQISFQDTISIQESDQKFAFLSRKKYNRIVYMITHFNGRKNNKNLSS